MPGFTNTLSGIGWDVMHNVTTGQTLNNANAPPLNPAGGPSVGARVYVPSGGSVTYGFTSTNASPSITRIASAASEPFFDENLSGGLNLYVTAVAGGTATYRYI